MLSLSYQSIFITYLFTIHLPAKEPAEDCISISLIQKQGTFENYYNNDKSLLEHFKFPEFFIRRTKKAYVSIVNDLVIELAGKRIRNQAIMP
jgi:hypothetical protein